MKNALQYYYNLKPKTIHQINCDYRCQVENFEYLFKRLDDYTDDISVIDDLNRHLLNRGLMCHQIVKNINQEILTNLDGNSYVLLKMFVDNREINEDDLLVFSSQYVEKNKYNLLDRSNWYELWTKKVDYIEYQASQLGKNYPLIRESINYYIGMAETAISLISNTISNDIYLTVSHRRIGYKNKLRDLYNPLDFVLDTRVRDLSEFYKERFFLNKVDLDSMKKNIYLYKLTSSEAVLFFARMMFPSYYFDCYQQIVLGELYEREINRYVMKAEEYQSFLKYLYFYLRQYYDIPEIEWIIKT